MNEETFDKIKELLINDGWIEQECGTLCWIYEYRTNFYKKDETKIIHLSYDAFAGEKRINQLKKKRDDIVIKECTKCRKMLYRGTEKDAKNLIIYCADCACPKS